MKASITVLFSMDSSSSENTYSILLPAWREAGNLPIIVYLIFEMAQKHNYHIEIVIIADGDIDGTVKVAEKLQKYIHKRTQRLGIPSAYKEGLAFAKGNFVITMDANLSHHVFFPLYFHLIGIYKAEVYPRVGQTDADIVVGSRFLKNAGGVYYRKSLNQILNFLASFVLGAPCSDSTGRFRIYKKSVLERILKEVESKDKGFQIEIVLRAKNYGYKIKEVPIVFMDMIWGESWYEEYTCSVYLHLKALWSLFWKF